MTHTVETFSRRVWIFFKHSVNRGFCWTKGSQKDVVGPSVDNSWWAIPILQPAWRSRMLCSVPLSSILLTTWLTYANRAWHGSHWDRTGGWAWAEQAGVWLGTVLHPRGRHCLGNICDNKQKPICANLNTVIAYTSRMLQQQITKT